LVLVLVLLQFEIGWAVQLVNNWFGFGFTTLNWEPSWHVNGNAINTWELISELFHSLNFLINLPIEKDSKDIWREAKECVAREDWWAQMCSSITPRASRLTSIHSQSLRDVKWEQKWLVWKLPHRAPTQTSYARHVIFLEDCVTSPKEVNFEMFSETFMCFPQLKLWASSLKFTAFVVSEIFSLLLIFSLGKSCRDCLVCWRLSYTATSTLLIDLITCKYTWFTYN